MEQNIKEEWEFWCKQNAELSMQEIAQARRVADYLEILRQHGHGSLNNSPLMAHVGSTSEEFLGKVAYFCPRDWVLEYTDEDRGWNNSIKVTIK